MVARLQVKASQIGKILQTLENKSNEAALAQESASGKKLAPHSNKIKSDETVSGSGPPPIKKSHYIDPIPPFNANKIRKSPSGNPTETIKDQISEIEKK